MADITVNGATRDKSVTTNAVPFPLLAPTATLNDTADTIEQLIQFEDVTPSPSTIVVADCTTDGTTTLTSTNSFITAGIKPGDAISGTDIAVGARVVSVATDGLSLVMSLAATGSTGALSITFTPPVFDATIAAVRTTLSANGDQFVIRVDLFTSNGSVNVDSDGDGADNATIDDLSLVKTMQATIGVESLQGNLRIAQSP